MVSTNDCSYISQVSISYEKPRVDVAVLLEKAVSNMRWRRKLHGLPKAMEMKKEETRFCRNRVS
jgi:hypothetical protein